MTTGLIFILRFWTKVANAYHKTHCLSGFIQNWHKIVIHVIRTREMRLVKQKINYSKIVNHH